MLKINTIGNFLIFDKCAEASIRLDLPRIPVGRFVTFCIKTKSKKKQFSLLNLSTSGPTSRQPPLSASSV